MYVSLDEQLCGRTNVCMCEQIHLPSCHMCTGRYDFVDTYLVDLPRYLCELVLHASFQEAEWQVGVAGSCGI